MAFDRATNADASFSRATKAAEAFNDTLPNRPIRMKTRAYGIWKYGIGKFNPSDATKYLWSRITASLLSLAVVAILALSAGAVNTTCEATDTLTSNLSLCQPAVDVEGSIFWGTKDNNNWSIVDNTWGTLSSTYPYNPINLLGQSPYPGQINLRTTSVSGFPDAAGRLKFASMSGSTELSSASVEGFWDEANDSMGIRMLTRYSGGSYRPGLWLNSYGQVRISTYSSTYITPGGINLEVANADIYANDGDIIVGGKSANVGQFAWAGSGPPLTYLDRLYRDSTDILHLQAPQQVYSILNISPVAAEPTSGTAEATLTLSRLNGAGTNGEGIDLFTFNYPASSDHRAGLNITRNGNGQFMEFSIAHHQPGSNDSKAFVVWPTTNVSVQYNLGIGTMTQMPATTLEVNGSAAFGLGAIRSTFTATPDGTTYALLLSSGLSIPVNTCINFGGIPQCGAAAAQTIVLTGNNSWSGNETHASSETFRGPSTFTASVVFSSSVAGLYNSSATYLGATLTKTLGVGTWEWWSSVSTLTITMHGNTYACMSWNCPLSEAGANATQLGFWVDSTYIDQETSSIGTGIWGAQSDTVHVNAAYKTQTTLSPASHTFSPMFLSAGAAVWNNNQKVNCWFEVHECP